MWSDAKEHDGLPAMMIEEEDALCPAPDHATDGEAREGAGDRRVLRPLLRLHLAGEQIFMGPGPWRLLSLVEQSSSVRDACRSMGLSYSKGWLIIGRMEKELGYAVLKRQQGGRAGGGSELTDEGRQLLARYARWSKASEKAVKTLFEEIFSEDL